MISYEQFCHIHHAAEQQGLTVGQIARHLGLNAKTVAKWLSTPSFKPRQTHVRASKLDPFKADIVRWLETHPVSATQVFQRLKDQGYDGGYSIVKEYVRQVRPVRRPAFLTLAFEPGECAQVDWGEWGSIAVGSTRRRLSFFVMVLCDSRLLTVRFTLSQAMEQFLDCHQRAFQFFGGVPRKVMVDNLKSAVLQRTVGQAPVFNRRYADFARHYGFTITPCNVRKGNEKGRVESGVGYVKKNFLNGLDLPPFSAMNPAVEHWLESVANVRVHGETHEPPRVRFERERAALQPLPTALYDIGAIHSVRASNRFRVAFEANRYSVPAEYASTRLTLKAYPDRIVIYAQDQLLAQHVREYDRHLDRELPDHPRELLAQRRKAYDQTLLRRFLALSGRAEHFYQALQHRSLNTRHHLRQILALSELYGADQVARAIDDAMALNVYRSEYIANILEQRQRQLPEPGALHLTRSQDLLELELTEPSLALYDRCVDPQPEK
jgi:transposase